MNDETIQNSAPPASLDSRTFTLRDASGATFVIDATRAGPALLGTGPAADFRLTDPTVSRRHCSVEVEDGELRVQDLGSTNGTRVQGVKVRDALLRGGESLQLGSTVMRVEAREARLAEPAARMGFGAVVGASLAMRRLYPLCERLAATDVPLVIEGETGTGKEVLAEAIHKASARRDGPYVVFDCTAVPPSLLEAELFGHERGAFTGAVGARKGVFEQAHGGTLLIDEIADVDIAFQSKLLRAIERSETRRVGGTAWIRSDVRVIAATRRNLDDEVSRGKFRDDLMHRISVARVELPPLRKRDGDVALLAARFAEEIGGAGTLLPPEILERFAVHSWPGNVRELRNAVARHIALGSLADTFSRPSRARSPADEGNAVAHEGDAADMVGEVLKKLLPLTEARAVVIDAFNERYVRAMLDAHGGNVTRAAAASGVARRYFQILIAKNR